MTGASRHRARAIVFDLDGVLVDSRLAWQAALDAIRARTGRDAVDPAEFAETFGQSSEADAERFFDGTMTRAELDAAYDEEFPRHVDRVGRVDPDADRALTALRAGGAKLAVATNAPGETARVMLGVTGLTPFFDLVVTADDVPRPKPEPDMLLEVCARLGVARTEVVFVGDSSTDVEAGRRAGIPVIGFRRAAGGGRIERLAELGTRVRAIAAG